MQGRGCPWHCLWPVAGRRPICSAMADEPVGGATQEPFAQLQIAFDSVRCQWEDAAIAHERGPPLKTVAGALRRGAQI
jgi:hypothetical protein